MGKGVDCGKPSRHYHLMPLWVEYETSQKLAEIRPGIKCACLAITLQHRRDLSRALNPCNYYQPHALPPGANEPTTR